MEAAAALADEEGIHEVTLASLSKRLNVKSPSLYNHIKGLNDLRKELALYGLTILYENMASAIQRAEENQAVSQMAHAYLAFAKNRPGLYEATFIAMPDEDGRLDEAGDRVLALVLSVLKDYHLDDEAAIHAVRGLRSILHGFAALRQHDAFGLPYDVEESLDLTIRVFLKGIAVYQTE